MTSPMPMTRGRRVALVLGLPVALALIGALAFNALALAAEVSYHVHRSFAAGAGPVRVSVDQADAAYRPGPGARIGVTGTLRGSLARPTFTWQATAGSLALHTQCRVPTGNCSEAFGITVPAGRSVRLSDSTGDMHASGFGGHVTLADGSGDIGVSRLSGVISLADSTGDIAAAGLNGSDVRLADGSGDIAVTGLASPSLRVTDSTGDVTITGLAGTDVTGKAGSGDIELVFTKVPRRVEVTDDTGDITLVLPSGPTRYQVQAGSQAGTTSITVPRTTSPAHVIIATGGSGNIIVR
jgi:hypothetical protein